MCAHQPVYVDFRKGDVRHSQADISKAAATLLGYAPTHFGARIASLTSCRSRLSTRVSPSLRTW
jgi:hypothetical protein